MLKSYASLPILAACLSMFLPMTSLAQAQSGQPQAISPTQFLQLQSSAQSGSLEATYNLGVAYLMRNLGTEDMAKALYWFKRSADGGNVHAMTNIGTLYIKGMGVEKDPDAAFSWFKKAAKLGEVRAQDNVAYMYSAGEGVNKDLVKAYIWYDLASRNGMPQDAQLRDRLMMDVPVADLPDAIKLTRALDPTHPDFD